MAKLFKVKVLKWAGETGLKKPGTLVQVPKLKRDHWVKLGIAEDVKPPAKKKTVKTEK